MQLALGPVLKDVVCYWVASPTLAICFAIGAESRPDCAWEHARQMIQQVPILQQTLQGSSGVSHNWTLIIEKNFLSPLLEQLFANQWVFEVTSLHLQTGEIVHVRLLVAFYF